MVFDESYVKTNLQEESYTEEQVTQPGSLVGATKHESTSTGGTEAEGTVIGGNEPLTTPAQNISCDPSSLLGLILKGYKYQRSYPIENVLTDVTFGITIRSVLKSMCAFKAFLSEIDPKKINKNLLDIDWIIAMQEELNQFERSKV